MSQTKFPKSLLEAARYFADPDVCVDFVASMRWPQGIACPHCEGKKVSYLKTRRIWKCMAKECHKQFSVKTQSVFEDSPLPLDKWLTAIWLVVNCKNGISSYEIARDLKVTQKSAWFMLHRIRLAMHNGNFEKLGGSGPVEVDEVYIGGEPKNRHKSSYEWRTSENWYGRRKVYVGDGKTGRGSNKIPVFGLLDRETRKVRAEVIPDVTRESLINAILENVQPGGKIYSDSFKAYKSLPAQQFVHKTVNHVKEYVRGDVHTNSLENFWSLLKRGLKGTYVAVEPFHLNRYLDEQIFRYNNRATKDNPLTDADRFALAVSQIAGKRLTYDELTGKEPETCPPSA